MLGDTFVFVRPGDDYVGIYIGEDATAYQEVTTNKYIAVRVAFILKKHARLEEAVKMQFQPLTRCKKVVFGIR